MEEELKKSILKTGTSILGIVCSDGVVLAADRQVSAGTLVVGKNFNKLIPVRDNVLVAITGGVSDAQFLLRVVEAELKLKEMRARRKASVKESASLISTLTFRNIRTPSMIPSIVGSLVAGFNADGSAKLYTIEPAGGIHEVTDYDANFSSGMPYILGVLEKEYKEGIKVSEAIELAKDCLRASTQRDMGSGYGIDIYSITKEGINKVVSQKIEHNFN